MNAPVNIVYPINGETYPKVDPGGGHKSAYLTFSFSTTCSGGPHDVKWGVNNDTLGSARFYDQLSAQFVWKLPAGTHVFWAKSDCGEDRVEFKVA